MSTSALRMVLDDLKELLRAKAISPAEYLEHSLAHSRASSLEKEVPVKMEALDTEMQEAPVKIEATVKSVKSVKGKATVKSVKGVKSVMKAPVKMEAPDTEMQEVVKEELITSVKCVKNVMTAPVMKEFVPPLPSPRQVGEKAPSDNNNNKEGKGERGGERGICVFFFFAHYILFIVEGEDYHHITRSGGKVNVD